MSESVTAQLQQRDDSDMKLCVLYKCKMYNTT